MKRLALGTVIAATLFAAACNSEKPTASEEKAVEKPAAAPAEATAQESTAEQAAPTRAEQSFAMGSAMGLQVIQMTEAYKQLGIELDIKQIEAGVIASLANPDQVDKSQLEKALVALEQERMGKVQEMQAQAQADHEAELAKNLAEGEAFLAENAKKEGVKVTETGLQYEVIAAGEGESPKATDKVKVHYRGTMIDGTEFDSSYSRNAPSEFFLNQVIAGWTEGVQLMKPGAKFKFYIPAELAYGEVGAGSGSIPGNSALIFDVELLEVNPSEEAEAKE